MIHSQSFDSSSGKKDAYTCHFDTETNRGRCNCRGWTQNAARDCTHCKQMRAKYGTGEAAPIDPGKPKILSPDFLAPMLAQPCDGDLERHLTDPAYAYEPKYDGIRLLACGTPEAVKLFARSGAEKTKTFPDLAEAVRLLCVAHNTSLMLDGEAVAIDNGRIVGFQAMQKRMGVTVNVKAAQQAQECAYAIFDLLKVGDRSYVNSAPWAERRTALNNLFLAKNWPKPIGRGLKRVDVPGLILGDVALRDGREMHKQALQEGWEGLIRKRVTSRYQPGARNSDWEKLKFWCRQEFVIGGWTEPRESRPYFGSIIVGVYEKGKLRFCGQAGTGFTHASLRKVYDLMLALETPTCPFETKPQTDEKAHWIRPELIAEIKYAEWTDDEKLRFPVYVGLRDDKAPTDVVIEKRPKFWR